MGREDLHHNMEDTFDDTEIIKTGDLVAYDCAYIGRARAYPLFFFSIDFAPPRYYWGERRPIFCFALRKTPMRDVDALFYSLFLSTRTTTAMEDNVFFYRDRTGWARGPCNLECMRKCWVNDIIDEHTLTWCNGLSDFLPIRNVRGLQRHIENPATKLHKFFVRTFVRTEKMLDEARAKHVEEGRSQGVKGSMDKAQVTAAWEEKMNFARGRALEKRQQMLAQHGKENLDEVVDVRTKKFMGIPYSWLKKKDEESYEKSEDDGLDRK